MLRRAPVSPIVATLLLIAAAALPRAAAQHATARASQLDPSVPAPSQAEMRERREKLIANQHADDEALNLYGRIEHWVERSGGKNSRVLDDRTYRVVPTGGGTMKILLNDHGAGVSADDYRRQLKAWKQVLETMTQPNSAKGQTARAKYEKRERQRAQFVDAAKNAFLPKWLGRQTIDGHSCGVFELLPNPEFHPSSIFEGALAHVTAKIWLDAQSDQLVRGEAWVTSDISFIAGIAGKVYRGSRVEMDQAQITPGVWLPIHYEYDLTGRKFLFPFGEHQTIDVKDYRRIGTPREALAEVETELASGKGPIADP
ncbi:MAG TPA: hypothetical protein VNK23_01135 [Candidatus Dormibacteraeota bacterium]|nr:hypothetical protein [Candidatus Dormibacteraeota bacterium]